MKLKYYLRGLGAGILFSVLVFVFVVSLNENELTDAEIIQRAKQLGMVEKTDSAIDMEKLRGESQPTLEPTPTHVPITVPTSTPSPTPNVTLAPTEVPETLPEVNDIVTPTPTEAAVISPTPAIEEKQNEVSAYIEIKGGMRSEDICALIKNAGLIDDAVSLNAYLIQNGYAEQLRVGKFELHNNMSFEEIAKHLTN